MFDYESKNVLFSKEKVESTSKVYKDGNLLFRKSSYELNSGSDIFITKTKDIDSATFKDKTPTPLFSIVAENEKNGISEQKSTLN